MRSHAAARIFFIFGSECCALCRHIAREASNAGNCAMTCRRAPYMNRLPEALVVKGYRHWLNGQVAGDLDAWTQAWELYANTLGTAQGRAAMNTLVNFVNALGRCATCPLRFLPAGSGHLCRDECLVLSLVAALQHGDDEAGQFSAEALTCRARCHDAIAAASEFAMSLKISGHSLLPVPQTTIANILAGDATRGRAATIH